MELKQAHIVRHIDTKTLADQNTAIIWHMDGSTQEFSTTDPLYQQQNFQVQQRANNLRVD